MKAQPWSNKFIEQAPQLAKELFSCVEVLCRGVPVKKLDKPSEWAVHSLIHFGKYPDKYQINEE